MREKCKEHTKGQVTVKEGTEKKTTKKTYEIKQRNMEPLLSFSPV